MGTQKSAMVIKASGRGFMPAVARATIVMGLTLSLVNPNLNHNSNTPFTRPHAGSGAVSK